jgi:hypothetical protein
LTAVRIAELAREPAPFDTPVIAESIAEIESDWQEVARLVEHGQAVHGDRKHAAGERLQRDTLEFIRSGAEVGERHHRLFRAAGNLREFDASRILIESLLTEAALDSGLPPSEVARQIRCGIEYADRQRVAPSTMEGGGV